MKLVSRYNEMIGLLWGVSVLVCSVLPHTDDEHCYVKCINKAQ